MTAPSRVLDAVVARLRAVLEPTADQLAQGTPRIHVGIIDDVTITDVLDTHTVPVPCVLLSCLQLPIVARDYGPTTVEAQIIARCVVRAGSASAGVVSTRGDVAMDLAALVASVVDEELWPGPGGVGTALSRATRIGARNVSDRALAGRGLSMWVVSWSQQVELSAVDSTGVLRSLRRLQLELEIDGGTSPDASGLLELEGREP